MSLGPEVSEFLEMVTPNDLVMPLLVSENAVFLFTTAGPDQSAPVAPAEDEKTYQGDPLTIAQRWKDFLPNRRLENVLERFVPLPLQLAYAYGQLDDLPSAGTTTTVCWWRKIGTNTWKKWFVLRNGRLRVSAGAAAFGLPPKTA